MTGGVLTALPWRLSNPRYSLRVLPPLSLSLTTLSLTDPSHTFPHAYSAAEVYIKLLEKPKLPERLLEVHVCNIITSVME